MKIPIRQCKIELVSGSAKVRVFHGRGVVGKPINMKKGDTFEIIRVISVSLISLLLAAIFRIPLDQTKECKYEQYKK